MDAEVTAGRATRRDVRLADPAQLMSIWETSDGGVVRLKPVGDEHRPGPTLSVEMKTNPAKPDRDPADIAFKLDERGRPVPKNPYELQNPTTVRNDQQQTFVDLAMDNGHWHDRHQARPSVPLGAG